MATNLFEKVQELQLKREKENQSMMDFMASLDGYGQIGYGLGTGLARLFSGDKKDSEMLQAEREDAYAKRVLMESDPKVQGQLLQGAYALSSELGQNLEAQLAEKSNLQLESDLTKMQIANYQSQINERNNPVPKALTPLTKEGKKTYTSLMDAVPSLKTKFDSMTSETGWFGTSKMSTDDIRNIVIAKADEFRQRNRVGYPEALDMAMADTEARYSGSMYGNNPPEEQGQSNLEFLNVTD